LTYIRPSRPATYSVPGRRDEQQQAHLVGALGVARRAELLGQVVADQRQVHLVQQRVADEPAHHLGLVLSQPQPRAFRRDQLAAPLLVRPVRGHPLGAEPVGPGQHLVEAQPQPPAGDARVRAQQPLHGRGQLRGGVVARQ
jgi:hypothetical protein